MHVSCRADFDKPGSRLSCKVVNSERPKLQIGRRVMSLQADVTGFQTFAFPWVLIRFARVLPIDNLVTIDPRRDAISLSD